VVYGVSRHGWPALEALDLSTGARSEFRPHACDAAWGRDDEIAYVHYSSFDVATAEYSGRIMVQAGLGGPPEAWTRDGAWSTPIWAGDGLFADARPVFAVTPDPLVVLYGPGLQRSIAGRSRLLGALSTVVAVNPQGTEVLLDTQRPGPGGSGVGSEDLATLLRVSDDEVLSAVLLTRNENGAIEALAPDGDWRGDEIITTDGIFAGGPSNPPAMIVTLTVDHNRVRLRSVKSFSEHGYVPEGDDLTSASPPRFLDGSGRRIALWFGDQGKEIREYVACDTLTDRCTGNSGSRPGERSGGMFVLNPSRP
jgi:hypothetical protein